MAFVPPSRGEEVRGRMKRTVTRGELLALLGVTGRANVERWEADGLPFVKVTGKRGKPAHVYDLERALGWLVVHASARISQRAKQVLSQEKGRAVEGEAAGQGGVASAGGTGPGAEGGASSTTTAERGLEGAYRRLEAAEVAWSAKRDEALEAGEISLASTCGRQAVVHAEALAKLRGLIREIDVAEGKLVDAAAVQGEFMKVLTTVKNNILGVPDSAVPLLIPFLRNPNDAPAIRGVLSKLVADNLRSVSAAGMHGRDGAGA